ncbi:hypothetical protein D3C86_1873650 [compost metagenome]
MLFGQDQSEAREIILQREGGRAPLREVVLERMQFVTQVGRAGARHRVYEGQPHRRFACGPGQV